MTRIKQAAAFFMTAALLSSAFAPAALADNKTKVGKICLTVDSDIRAGSSGGEVDVTPTGDNTDLYYVDAVEVVNDEGDDWSKSNPPEVDITLGLEDEEEYAFSGTSSSSFKLTLDSSIKSRFDKIKFVDARKTDGGATVAPRLPPETCPGILTIQRSLYGMTLNLPNISRFSYIGMAPS